MLIISDRICDSVGYRINNYWNNIICAWYSYYCNRNARSWNIKHFLYRIFLTFAEWKPKATLYRKLLPTHSAIQPILNQFQYNHHAYNTHIHILYTYNILYYVLMCSLVFVVLIFIVLRHSLSFSSSLSLLMKGSYESLLEFYTTCLRVACLPLARLKI